MSHHCESCCGCQCHHQSPSQGQNACQGGHGHCGCSCHSSKSCHQGAPCSCKVCQENKGSCSSKQEESCHRACQLLALADEAWLEVLKEKLKERIRAHDQRIDQLADVIAETNRQRWHNKMSEDQVRYDYANKIKEFIYQTREGNKSK